MRDRQSGLVLVSEEVAEVLKAKTTAEIAEELRSLNKRLGELWDGARELGIIIPKPALFEPMPLNNRELVKAWAFELQAQHVRLNEEVWPREEELKKETKQNRPFREFGELMHDWHDDWKSTCLFPLEIGYGSWIIQPYLKILFNEVSRRSIAGDKVAKRLLKDKWDMQVTKK